MSRPRDVLKQAPILTIGALLLFGGLIAYAVLHGSGVDNSPPVTEHTPQATLGPSVIFAAPLEGTIVEEPVDVRLAIGGLRFQGAGATVAAGYGHLGLIIDGATPAPGDTFIADASHIDLKDGSHETTLASLSPGDHVLTAVFANANDVITSPLAAQTIHITVGPASS